MWWQAAVAVCCVLVLASGGDVAMMDESLQTVSARTLLSFDPKAAIPKEVNAKIIAKGANVMAQAELPYIVKYEQARAKKLAKQQAQAQVSARKAALSKLHKTEQAMVEKEQHQAQERTTKVSVTKSQKEKQRSNASEKALKADWKQIQKKKKAKLAAQAHALKADKAAVVATASHDHAILKNEVVQMKKAGDALVQKEDAIVRNNLKNQQQLALKKAESQKMKKSSAELALKQDWVNIEKKQAAKARQVAKAHAALSWDLAQHHSSVPAN